jgi:hypothetical protein
MEKDVNDQLMQYDATMLVFELLHHGLADLVYHGVNTLEYELEDGRRVTSSDREKLLIGGIVMIGKKRVRLSDISGAAKALPKLVSVEKWYVVTAEMAHILSTLGEPVLTHYELSFWGVRKVKNSKKTVELATKIQMGG